MKLLILLLTLTTFSVFSCPGSDVIRIETPLTIITGSKRTGILEVEPLKPDGTLNLRSPYAGTIKLNDHPTSKVHSFPVELINLSSALKVRIYSFA